MNRYTLGIETSCDETAAAVACGGRVLSSVVSSSVHLHKRYGGVVPEIASRYHVEYIIEVLDRSLKDAGVRLGDIGLVAVTCGPGLVGALLTGIATAKGLSMSLGIPLIGVNHILAHLYSSFLSEGERPAFPFIGVVVSGGHTALFHCRGMLEQRMLGQTQDDAVGEAFDKVAKILGLGYPGGPAIERASYRSSGKNVPVFPKGMLKDGSFDFSFSGIKTAVLYYTKRLTADGSRPLTEGEKDDICYAFQESALDVIIEKAIAAAHAKGARHIVVGGGVAANKRFRAKFAEATGSCGLKAFFPDLRYSMDNAAMIAALGEALYRKGERSTLYLNADPNLKA